MVDLKFRHITESNITLQESEIYKALFEKLVFQNNVGQVSVSCIIRSSSL